MRGLFMPRRQYRFLGKPLRLIFLDRSRPDRAGLRSSAGVHSQWHLYRRQTAAAVSARLHPTSGGRFNTVVTGAFPSPGPESVMDPAWT
jgi:hypothetical protein